jgi:predicted transcriptional regulator
MKNNASVKKILRTNCTIVEAEADVATIRYIFDFFPYQFLPVLSGLRFIGVILRDEFMAEYVTNRIGDRQTAADFITKEMVVLGPQNTVAEAREIFETKLFDLIPVVDHEGDMMGIILREDLEAFLNKRFSFF